MDIKLPNEVDPTHLYTFKSGEYGTYYQYWWKDRAGNYWKYSNAPMGHKDFDSFGGDPILDPDQPFPHLAPQFFTPEGYRRHIGLPKDAKPTSNPGYNPASLDSIWFEYYRSPEGGIRYVYLDKDVKENLDLYIQHQIRLVDAGLVKLRKYANYMFTSQHTKDRILGAVSMLVDQAYYTVDELVEATVGDLSFVDETAVLLGRKFKCDADFMDFLTSLVAGRSLTDPLFTIKSIHSTTSALSKKFVYAYFAFLRVSPVFLRYWHATHVFSRIVNRMAALKVPADQAKTAAFVELANVFNTSSDIRFLVDPQVLNTLMAKYEASMSEPTEPEEEEQPGQPGQQAQDQSQEAQQPVAKSMVVESSDEFGVAQVWSDMTDRRPDELEFSTWLHAQPLHTDSEASEAAITSQENIKAKEVERRKTRMEAEREGGP